MNKKENHNLNDREAFFKFLDEQSGHSSMSSGELDEFEKEALEGFEETNTSAAAQEMLSEIDRKISLRIDQKQKKGYRFIWFAAASVLLVVSGWFFFNQFADKQESTIALSETKEQALPEVQKESVPALPAEEKAAAGKEVNKSKVNEQTIKSESQPLATYNAVTAVYEKDSKKAEAEGEVLAAKTAATRTENDQLATVTTNDADVTTKGDVTGYANNNGLNKEENVTVKDEMADIKQQPMAYTSVQELEKSEEKNNDKAKYKKSAAEKSVAPSSVNRKAVALDSVSFAWYAGDEVAVQKEVLKYIYQNYPEQRISGKFKVKLLIHADASATTLEVVQITKNICNNCNTVLKEALDHMKGWKPALSDGQPFESEKELLLEFK